MAKAKSKSVVNTLGEHNTTLYHSNRITNSFISEMSNIGVQIFVEIIKELQHEIRLSKDNAKQLDLFLGPDYMSLKIAYKDVTDKRKYSEVADALESLRKTTVNMQSVDQKNYIKFTGLISAYEIPDPEKKGIAKYFYVKLDKDVATYLISIDQSNKGGIFYTKWLYEVSKKASNVYTVRLYWLISSWQRKGFFDISYEMLRKMVGVADNTYPNYAHFRKRILETSNKQLEEISNCWLDLNVKYEIKQGTKVVGFKFKILTREALLEGAQQKEIQIASVEKMLIRAFEFTTKDITQMQEMIREYNIPYDLLIEKIIYIDEHIKTKSIKNKAAFAMKSLRNEFVG